MMSLPVIGEQQDKDIRNGSKAGSNQRADILVTCRHVANVPTSDFSLKCEKTPTEVGLHQF
jgi:hypothetical protein